MKKLPFTNLFLILLTTLPQNFSFKFEVMSSVASEHSILLNLHPRNGL